MAYTNFTNCTEQEYLDIIYSQDDKNRIRIWFNNVELEDAGEYCENLSGINRILPNDGEKRFSLDNFIAREYNLILRDLPAGTTIADQVKISIGTLVGENTYEDVPIGIFNIQDTPVTDKNKVTIKLRDNRVKFDFGYDAKPLIDAQGGSATYKQILNDICTKAGVINDVSTFNGESIAVAIYDNTIKGSTYVAYIAEQAGAIPVITREGHLNFIYLNNLKTWRIPLSIVEKYEIGKPFEVERVVYESGIIKYQTSPDETLETLYLDAANPYVSRQAQVNSVLTIMNGFTIDSAETGRILGNPAIDAYDLIEIYDDDTDDTILTTLANNTYTFNGVHRQTFDTTIGEEERKENVTITSEATARRWAKTEIDNLNATVTITTGKVEDLEQSIEVLRADLDTNVAIVSVDSSGKPFASKTYEINYSVKYLGDPLLTGYSVSTSDSHTGITTDFATLGTLKFIVSNATAITTADNKYTITFSYTNSGTTFTSTRTVMISTLESESEQNVIISITEPEDKSVLWYNQTDNTLKKYNPEITIYELAEDTTFAEDKSYYELVNDEYLLIDYDSTTHKYTLDDGTVYSVGDTIPSNKIYVQETSGGDWSEVNNNSDDILRVENMITGEDGLNSKYTSLEDRIKDAETDLNNKVDSATYNEKITQIESVQTNTYKKEEIRDIVNGTGVGGLTVTAVRSFQARFDMDGMHYQKSTTDTISTINEQGLRVDDKNNNELFFAGVREGTSTSIVQTSNLNSSTYVIFGNNKGRLQEFTDPEANLSGVGLFLL